MAVVVTRGNVYTCDVEATDRPSATVVSQGSLAICVDTGKTYINENGTWTQIDAAGVGSYTDEEAQDAVGTILTDTATIDFTYTDATPSITADVKNDSITYAKIQNVTDDRLIGRSAGSAGDAQEITVGSGLVLDTGALTLDPAIVIAGGDWGLLEIKSGSPDTPDDDFNSGTLAAKWSVSTGVTSGTVSMTTTSNIEIYDLTSKSGWCLIQAGATTSQYVQLIQNYTLPDGKCLVAKLAPTMSNANNSWQQTLSITNSGMTAYVQVFYDQDVSGANKMFSQAVGNSAGTLTSHAGADLAPFVLLRIDRHGLVYWCYYSFNGGNTWSQVGSATFASALDYFHIAAGPSSSQTAGYSIPWCGFDWVRQGTAGAIKPW